MREFKNKNGGEFSQVENMGSNFIKSISDDLRFRLCGDIGTTCILHFPRGVAQTKVGQRFS